MGPPSGGETSFKNNLNIALNNANSSIGTAYSVEPYDVNRNEYGVLLGYVNFAPSYNSCQ